MKMSNAGATVKTLIILTNITFHPMLSNFTHLVYDISLTGNNIQRLYGFKILLQTEENFLTYVLRSRIGQNALTSKSPFKDETCIWGPFYITFNCFQTSEKSYATKPYYKSISWKYQQHKKQQKVYWLQAKTRKHLGAHTNSFLKIKCQREREAFTSFKKVIEIKC